MKRGKCHWHQEGECDYWGTGCGKAFTLTDGTPSDNEMEFCPFCGDELVEHPISWDEDDETGEAA